MSCGAALFNLRLAIEAAGRGAVVDLVPDAGRPELLAALRVSGVRPVTPEQATLMRAVPRRVTNRRPFAERPVPAAHRAALVRAAEAERAHLVVLDTPKELDTFVALLRRADHHQGETPGFRSELHTWTHRDPEAEDGVPNSAGVLRPTGRSSLTPKRFPPGAVVARPFGFEPLVAMLTTDGDTPGDHVRAGLAVQRVLLSATVLGLSASFLSQPVELPGTRVALRTLLDVRGHPQTVLRIGYGQPTGRTPRRPVSAVTSSLTGVRS